MTATDSLVPLWRTAKQLSLLWKLCNVCFHTVWSHRSWNPSGVRICSWGKQFSCTLL